MTAKFLVSLYTYLAEVLSPQDKSNLPGWFAAPGKEWPLFLPATQLTNQVADAALGQAVAKIVEVPSNSIGNRWEEFKKLFLGIGAPSVWLYESKYIDGRMPGPSTFAVKTIYGQAGLEVGDAELPDHASIELAFLAWLAQMEITDLAQANDWRASRRLFVKNHPGRWLPEVGHQLSLSPYPAWAAIGQLLAAVLCLDPRKNYSRAHASFPLILKASDCNLCGFCVQVCPTDALAIREDEEHTALWLQPNLCVRCGKCVQICVEEAVGFYGENGGAKEILLKESPRATCPMCGSATISQAELEAAAGRLGNPEWLEYCLDCRVTPFGLE